jgi:hypothetical protein
MACELYYYYYYYYYLTLQPCMGFGLLYQIIPGFHIFNELDPISPFWLLEIIYYLLNFSIFFSGRPLVLIQRCENDNPRLR